MKTLVYSSHGFDKPFLKASKGLHEMDFVEKRLSIETVFLAEGYQAVALFSSDNASEEVLKKLNELGIKYIALRSVGYDNVDLNTAKSLGIKVANVPAYSPYAIAEHSVALLMALNRKLLLGQDLMKSGDYRLDHLIGFDLYDKTVGVVGTGKIGAAFTQIMNGFGCKLLGYDIEINDELVQSTNIKYTSLEELCMQSDVISINCPLNEQTKYLFNKTLFSKMKKGVVFINTARGGVVNTVDLIEAIDLGIIGAAGLDVYENEKPIFFFDNKDTPINDELFLKLKSYDNVLITGHQAFLTNEALKGITDTTIENLNSWEEKGYSINEVC